VAARAGIGLTLLPCYLGDPEPALARALPHPVPALARELWIVTHQDLRRTARVRAFFDVVTAGSGADRALIEGAVTDLRAPLSAKAGNAPQPAFGVE
jgi:DNA-binding transcriptional LysR family regulator